MSQRDSVLCVGGSTVRGEEVQLWVKSLLAARLEYSVV